MKKYNKILVFFFFTLLGVWACSSEDKPDGNVSVISVDNKEKTAFDAFLKKKYIDPYNIEFLYRLADIESDMSYTLVPATYENSVKMANLVKYLCLDAYEEVAPDGFLEKYFPKMLMLVGSPAYNNNGTIVLGTAEGGLKITLYAVNSLDVSNVEVLYRYYFRTIFHEFSHILHQNKDYSNDFREITPSAYVGGSWNTISNAAALQAGFISPYSMKEYNEDFVELIAHYITYTDAQWNAAMTTAGATGSARIEEKMAIVKSYMINTWDVDLDALKAEVLARGNNLSNVDLDNID